MLLDEIAPSKSDTVYFLGDLINRGPDSHGVLEIARSIPNARALWGNHELRFLRYHKTKDPQYLKSKDWETLPKIAPQDWEFLEKNMSGPIYLKQMNTLLVHGGFLPNIPWMEQGLDITTEIQVIGSDGKPYRRGKCAQCTPWQHLWQGPPYVIYGHTPRAGVERLRWTLGIDTGCCLGGYLSACILPSKEIVQVPARKKYHNKPLFY